MKASRLQQLFLLVLVGLLVGLITKHQALQDWLRLRGYSAPTAVAQLASEDTMTPQARHLFYVNRPVVTSGPVFTSHCPAGGEKTIVLGCYIGNDSGIYVYAVSDVRLNGVEQVTAAHEMLHAAYRRLSSSERAKIDGMLQDYYAHQLTDERIKTTIDAYKQSEPNDVVNEMHSIFGTEVANLPAPLEQYYQQYFTDRATVTTFAANYQAEFTSRKAQVSEYDAQLKRLKAQIDTNQASLDQQKTAIDGQDQQLQQARASGNIAAYNNGIAGYNQLVNQYNAQVVSTKSLINQYNDIVVRRNAIALEEQQLTQELSANNVTK